MSEWRRTVIEAFWRSALQLALKSAFYSAIAAVVALSFYWLLFPPWPTFERTIWGYAVLTCVFVGLLILFRFFPSFSALRAFPPNAIELESDLVAGRFVDRVLSNYYVAKYKEFIARGY